LIFELEVRPCAVRVCELHGHPWGSKVFKKAP
jgi:hypothetical protein